MTEKKTIYILALGAQGEGISGGDRIFIELARWWSKKYSVHIFVWEEGSQMIERQGLLEHGKLHIFITHIQKWSKFGFFITYFIRVLSSIQLAFTLTLENKPDTIIYNASEFWMDSLPTIILKLRFSKVTWLATWYQTAPNPIQGFAEGSRKEKYRFSAFLYWFAQLPIRPFISYLADFVIVNNEDERKRFPKQNHQNRIFVMIGAVKVDEITAWMQIHPKIAKKYDAVFQGRFHPQKGVVEMIDIWANIVSQLPKAKLAMIGDGPLMPAVKQKIEELHLRNNIDLLGYVFDGDLKYTTFAQSKIVVHPAFYDSGGMASAEAMAFGSPCVGFDLVSYKSYYPQGMIKVPIGDINAFANVIISLLKHETERKKIAKEASDMIQKSWSWQKRAEDVISLIDSVHTYEKKS